MAAMVRYAARFTPYIYGLCVSPDKKAFLSILKERRGVRVNRSWNNNRSGWSVSGLSYAGGATKVPAAKPVPPNPTT